MTPLVQPVAILCSGCRKLRPGPGTFVRSETSIGGKRFCAECFDEFLDRKTRPFEVASWVVTTPERPKGTRVYQSSIAERLYTGARTPYTVRLEWLPRARIPRAPGMRWRERGTKTIHTVVYAVPRPAKE